jgi:hypothetical protein
MPALGTAVAYITIDNKKLPEYKVEKTLSGNAISCYIPSEAGKVRSPAVFAAFRGNLFSKSNVFSAVSFIGLFTVHDMRGL